MSIPEIFNPLQILYHQTIFKHFKVFLNIFYLIIKIFNLYIFYFLVNFINWAYYFIANNLIILLNFRTRFYLTSGQFNYTNYRISTNTE